MNKKPLILTICSIILTIMFFSYNVVITYDSSHYLWLTNMLTANDTFSNWDIARGIVFPFIIFTLNTFLGFGGSAILIGMFVAYIIMITVCYLIYKDITKNVNFISKKYKVIQVIIFVITIVLNPIVFGYYHALLTEFVAMTISILMCYFSWKWIEQNLKESRKNYLVTSFMFFALSIFSWHLKQPYVTIVLVPLFVASIISIIKDHSKVNVLSKVITNGICFVGIFISILVWNKILLLNKVNMDDDRSSAGFFSKMIVEGISNYSREFNVAEYTLEKVQANEKISEYDKKQIYKVLNHTSTEYRNFIILRQADENSKDMDEVIFLKDDQLTTRDAISFTLKTLVTKPTFLFEGYISNYLAIANIYKTDFELGTGKILVVKKFDLFQSIENSAIAYRPYETGMKNTFPISERYSKYVQPYENNIRPVLLFNFYMKNMEKPASLLFKFIFLLSPILLVISIIGFFKNTKKYNYEYNKILNLIIILYSYSFIHILCHAILGSSIDRYAIPAYITTIMAMFLNVYIIVFKDNFLKINKMLEVKNEKL